MGGFTGKLGTAVGYQWRGKWCVRSLQPLARNPRTEAQQQHRMMFKQEVQLAGHMHWVLRETFEAVSYEKHMTPCNYFVSRNQHAFRWEEGALAVDWASLVLSEGPVAPVAFGVPHIDEGNVLSISFEKNPQHARVSWFDSVYLYVYCPALEQDYLTAPVYRREGRMAVALPDQFSGQVVQLWGMVKDLDGRWSETLYIGYGPLETNMLDTDDEVIASDTTKASVAGETAAEALPVAALGAEPSAAASAPH